MQDRQGPRPFDVATRQLIESDPVGWLTWLGLPVDGPVTPIDSNVSTVLAEVDNVLRIDGPTPWLAHVELQASRAPALPLRLLQYHALLLFRHRHPVATTVVLLRPQADAPELSGLLEQAGPRGDITIAFRFDVVRLWERPVEELLGGSPRILPLAPLAAVDPADVPAVIRRIDARLAREVPASVSADLWATTLLLLGLRYDAGEAQQLLRGVRRMRESSTYQAILQEGRAEGRVEGRVEGQVAEARRILLLVGRGRLGEPPARTAATLDAIDDLERLEEMIARAITATSWQDLLAGDGPH